MNRLPLCQAFFASLFLWFSLFLSLPIVSCLKASQAVSHLSSTLFGTLIAFSSLMRMKLHGKAICFDMLAFECFYMLLYAFICFYMLPYAFICFHTLSYTFKRFHNMLSYALVCFYTLSYAFICFHILSYAFICFHMLSYAFICFQTLSYAFICFHMLSYAFYMLLDALYGCKKLTCHTKNKNKNKRCCISV